MTGDAARAPLEGFFPRLSSGDGLALGNVCRPLRGGLILAALLCAQECPSKEEAASPYQYTQREVFRIGTEH